MEQQKVYHLILTEADIVTLGNLNITLLENKEGLSTLIDQYDNSGMNLWEVIDTFLPHLQTVVMQLPM